MSPESSGSSRRVLNRYTLDAPQRELEAFYPGAQVWTGSAISSLQIVAAGSPATPPPIVTVIVWPLVDTASAGRTTRVLWSAELRKLFRLTSLPFDPALVGFVDGGYDEPGKSLVLVMEDVSLPTAEKWLQGEIGKPAAAQWRGRNLANRAELWVHISGLFRALASVHESRIVHRRIAPNNLLIDESVSRDQGGFIKLGRFEASTFFHSVRAIATTPAQPIHDPAVWYAIEPTPIRDKQALAGTPAADVYSLLLSALWLLTGRPDGKDLARFYGALRNEQVTQALIARRNVLSEAVNSLRHLDEINFFEALTRGRFSTAVAAAHYRFLADRVASRLRKEGEVQAGPLCLVLTRKAQQDLAGLWTDTMGDWREWLIDSCRKSDLVEGNSDPYQRFVNLILPNGWLLLCAVFRTGGGFLDWTRLSVNSVAAKGSSSRGTPISLNEYELNLLENKRLPPPNARSWQPLLEAAGARRDTAIPAQEALERLNFAELRFWEENVVPVHITGTTVTWNGDHGEEIVDVEQLLDDREYPLNPLVRNEEPPDFVAILQDKSPPIHVELSETKDLWDRRRQSARWIKPTFQVHQVPERQGGSVRAIKLSRAIQRSDDLTKTGQKGYFKTKDQGWQMGLFERRRRGIDSLPRHAVLAEVLRHPTSRQRHVEPLPLRLPYKPWSAEKDRLVANTLATGPLFLVQGPPGTGKSTYVAGLMQYILSTEEDPSARILVVALMHSAIDDLKTRVESAFSTVRDMPLLVRLLNPKKNDDEEQVDKEMATKAQNLFSECLAVISTRCPEPTYAAAYRSLSIELASPSPSEDLQQRIVDAASVVFTTCTDAYLDKIGRTEFDWVIIEEAGRLIGCDLVIPMRLGHRWVLIGDPEQIGTYRKEDFGEVLGTMLGRSPADDDEDDQSEAERDRSYNDCLRLLGPFETLYSGLDPRQREKLAQQYRMHPHIRQVISNSFYEGSLTDDPETAARLCFLFDKPASVLNNRAVLWLDIPKLRWPNNMSCTDEKESGGFSFSNPAELAAIRLLLDELAKCSPEDTPDPLTVVGITFYKRQMRELISIFNKWRAPAWVANDGKRKPRVLTVAACQGQEADIVVLSMVRNNAKIDFGFLNKKQMNVALSRARRLLVVVGCFEMLKERAEAGSSDDRFLKLLVRELEPYTVPAIKVFPEVTK